MKRQDGKDLDTKEAESAADQLTSETEANRH